MAEHRVSTYKRLRYFNGLFLKAADFTTESDYHVATRRYLSYLLFAPGVLYGEGSEEPLQVSGAGTTVIVAPGAAMISDQSTRQGHEVHLDQPAGIDLGEEEPALADGTQVYISIGFLEEGVFSTGEEGGGSVLPDRDRLQEYAVLSASTSEPADSSVLLAEVVYRTAGIQADDVTDRRVRGGLRREILSQELIDSLAAVPMITGIEPAESKQDTTLTEVAVTGENLSGASSVTFVPAGGLSVSNLTVVGDGRITFRLEIAASANAGSRNFRVVTPAGIGRSEDFGVTFAVLPSIDPPTIAAIEPAQGAQNTSIAVTVTGENLEGASIQFESPSGLIVRNPTVVNANQFTFDLQIHAGAVPGDRRFRVTTPGGIANSDDFGVSFSVTEAVLPARISGISPASGVQGLTLPRVEVTGQHLSGTSELVFLPSGGLNVSDLTVESDTLLSFRLEIADGAAAGTRSFWITTPAGTARSEDFGISFAVSEERVLVSIEITAGRSAIPRHDTEQFKATGLYSSGPTADLTYEVEWSSSDTDVAEIDGDTGVAEGNHDGATVIRAALDSVQSDPFLLVVGEPKVDSWPDDISRRAHGTETLRIYGDRFVNPLRVAFRNAATGGENVVADGTAESLTEATVVVPGPYQPTNENPALVKSGRINVITTAGESSNSPQNFILETV